MAFELQDTPGDPFQQLNRFFSTDEDDGKLLELSQELDLPQARIHSNEWYFNGIRMGYSDWHYKEPVDLKWNYQIHPEMVTLQVNLTGSVFIGNSPDAHLLFENAQHNLFYANSNEVNEGFIRPSDMRSSMFFVQFRKNAFMRLTADANDALTRFGESILQGKPAALSAGHLPLGTAMVNLIRNVLNCGYTEGLKKMYLLSKSIEFLVLQAEACSAALVPYYKYAKTPHDVECIRYAREYILRNLEEPPSLSQLARIVGINEYKLKRGFKEIFGNTVFGYLSDARLEMACTDLAEGKKPTSEIAAALGYSSVQHFGNAFRKKFGTAPGKWKKSVI
jgi:AraC family transcriptional activator of pyochelin receptor